MPIIEFNHIELVLFRRQLVALNMQPYRRKPDLCQRGRWRSNVDRRE